MNDQNTFINKQAVEKAMYQFWLKGYEATTVPELIRIMNLNQVDFEKRFGSKENLLIHTMSHYLDHIFIPELEKLSHAKEFSAFFERMLTPRKSGTSGCYMLTISSETADSKPKVLQLLKEYVQRIQQVLEEVVEYRYPSLTDAERKMKLTQLLSLFTSIPLVHAIISPEMCLEYTREMLSLIES